MRRWPLLHVPVALGDEPMRPTADATEELGHAEKRVPST